LLKVAKSQGHFCNLKNCQKQTIAQSGHPVSKLRSKAMTPFLAVALQSRINNCIGFESHHIEELCRTIAFADIAFNPVPWYLFYF
jgi:hypothetical protein